MDQPLLQKTFDYSNYNSLANPFILTSDPGFVFAVKEFIVNYIIENDYSNSSDCATVCFQELGHSGDHIMLSSRYPIKPNSSLHISLNHGLISTKRPGSPMIISPVLPTSIDTTLTADIWYYRIKKDPAEYDKEVEELRRRELLQGWQ